MFRSNHFGADLAPVQMLVGKRHLLKLCFDQLLKAGSLCVGRLHYGHLAPCQLGVQALDHGTAASNS